jgi:hypothetical protein
VTVVVPVQEVHQRMPGGPIAPLGIPAEQVIDEGGLDGLKRAHPAGLELPHHMQRERPAGHCWIDQGGLDAADR